MRASLRRHGPFALALAVFVVLWWHYRFLCDDAFLAFRYVGSAHDGHGLVWNRPPFAPVEGYSCFLWVLLLWATWGLTGVPPPQSANWLALGCAVASLWLGARALQRVPRDERQERWRPGLAALALLAIATDSTVVTWASSGLETALFGLCAIGWTLAVAERRALGAVSTWAALAMLTRPDGMLLGLATAALAAWSVLRRWWSPRALWGLLPFVAPLAHVLWRRWFYGEWLPNTYYAKVTAAWPASGLRYLFCFAVEHALALPALVAVVFVAARKLRFAAFAAAGTWAAFVGYYALVVGGDHFAFRPFAHLVPLVALSLFAMLAGLRVPALASALLLAAYGAAGNWFGHCYEHALAGRDTDGFARVRDVGPAWLLPGARAWERDRAWLRLHYVALPRGLHAATCEGLLALLPERRPGQVTGSAPGQRLVFRTVAAGVVSWALPDVDIVDAVGLNDWVVARNTTPPAPLPIPDAALDAAFALFDADHDARLDAAEIGALAGRLDLSTHTGVLVSARAWADLLLALADTDGDDALARAEFAAAVAELRDTRHMAHERTPPAGYVEALRPNVVQRPEGGFAVVPGVPPLGDAEVERVERQFRARLGR
ncbi:MAG: hypothetical protein U1E73_07190 [Planctomycetota bacterium]